METQTRKIWHIIGRGFNGWHAKGVNVSSSGGDIAPYTYWTGERVAGYFAEAIDGALVYDASSLKSDAYRAFIKVIVGGPMVSPGLEQDECAGALSYITVATFMTSLRAIAGIQFGRIVNGVVIWE